MFFSTIFPRIFRDGLSRKRLGICRVSEPFPRPQGSIFRDGHFSARGAIPGGLLSTPYCRHRLLLFLSPNARKVRRQQVYWHPWKRKEWRARRQGRPCRGTQRGSRAVGGLEARRGLRNGGSRMETTPSTFALHARASANKRSTKLGIDVMGKAQEGRRVPRASCQLAGPGTRRAERHGARS